MRHMHKAAAHHLLGLVVGGCGFGSVTAQAAPFELLYTGTFNTQEALAVASASTPAYFTALTPFTIHALFDDSSSNLAPSLGGPFNSFRAYAPSSTMIDIAGTSYSIESILTNPSAGVTVAIFDQNSFVPGHYGIGLIADPVNQGAGFVGDFGSALPAFTVPALLPTTFGDYFGVGHSSGVCTAGTPPICPHTVTPWILHDSSNLAYTLTLGDYAEDYPNAHSPGASVGALNSAQIVAASEPPPASVHEPSSYMLVLIGLLGLGWSGRSRVARAGLCTAHR